MSSFMFTLNGLGTTVEWGKGGPRIKEDVGGFAARNFADAAYVNVSGLDATLAAHFVTLAQLNAVSVGIQWKESARVCSTVNVDIAVAPASIDGIAMAAGDRIMLIAQTTPTQNGLWEYVAAAAALIRPVDWAVGTDQSGSAVIIREGTCADNAYLASADPAIVNTDDPVMLLFASVAAGVTSVALAGTATGVSPIVAGPTGAVTLVGFTGESGVLSAALVAGDIEYSVDVGGIGTAKIADDAVTEAKLAPGALLVRRVAFGFADFPGTVAIGAAVPAGDAMEARFVVNTAFDAVPTGTIGHGGDPDQLMTAAENDLTRAGVYVVDIDAPLTPAAVYNATLAGSPTVGAGIACFTFRLS